MKIRIMILMLVVAVDVSCYCAFKKKEPWLARKAWKEEAIQRIEEWTRNDVYLTKRRAGLERSDWWLSQSVALMGNGEWVVYQMHTNHRSPRTVGDIIIAKASDGKWYYSSLHGCWLYQDDQPPSLEWFVRTYNFRQFDGKSNACLQKTAPHPAYASSTMGDDEK